MLDMDQIVANARYTVVTTLDTGETSIANATNKGNAERLLSIANRGLGLPDFKGRIRVSVKLVDKQV